MSADVTEPAVRALIDAITARGGGEVRAQNPVIVYELAKREATDVLAGEPRRWRARSGGGDQGQRADRGTEPVRRVHPEVDASAKPGGSDLVDRRVDRRVFAADRDPGRGGQ